jgi:hypothetical protein
VAAGVLPQALRISAVMMTAHGLVMRIGELLFYDGEQTNSARSEFRRPGEPPQQRGPEIYQPSRTQAGSFVIV